MLAFEAGAQPPVPFHGLYLVEETNHRVANEYAEAISMLSLAAARAGTASVRDALIEAADRLLDHAACHRSLLPPDFAGSANLGDHIGQICSAFAKATLARRDVRLLVETDDIVLPADRCWLIGLVVAELVRNATRHGLADRGGTILVRIAEAEGQLTCMVCDTGHAVAWSSSGRGQRLVRSLVSELGGVVAWSFTPQGGMAHLILPADPASQSTTTSIETPDGPAVGATVRLDPALVQGGA